MIRIVMCDDNTLELASFSRRIKMYLRARTLHDQVALQTYSSSLSLWYKLADEDVGDIFILDVDMPKMNGIELADYIHSHHPSAIIFFLTSHMEYASEGYKVEALRYIRKNASDIELFEAIDYALQKYNHLMQKHIVISHYRDSCKLPISEIVYVQRISRMLQIYTRAWGVFTDNRGIQDLFDDINDSHFLFIDRSTFVNIDYIQRTSQNEIILYDETHLNISRRNITAVKSAIANLWK